mmetsp:Transcript_57280/g.161787  ORF Transcript_57280/g.161787 Transcript_57280/m.161787 type:complete len:226 (+) Transcript_57280:567-1244(+)
MARRACSLGSMDPARRAAAAVAPLARAAMAGESRRTGGSDHRDSLAFRAGRAFRAGAFRGAGPAASRRRRTGSSKCLEGFPQHWLCLYAALMSPHVSCSPVPPSTHSHPYVAMRTSSMWCVSASVHWPVQPSTMLIASPHVDGGSDGKHSSQPSETLPSGMCVRQVDALIIPGDIDVTHCACVELPSGFSWHCGPSSPSRGTSNTGSPPQPSATWYLAAQPETAR